MSVPSFEFLGFAALVALAINISEKPAWRRFILFLANVAFVLSLSHDPKDLAPFFMFLVVGFIAIKVVERIKGQGVYTLMLVLVLLLFCWLKQYAFVPHGLFLPYVYLTVGLSYVFFRVLHLVIEAHDDNLPGRLDPYAYFTYTMNFACLISGPIQLYRDYLETESLDPLAIDLPAIGSALGRIVLGFFKVTVLSAPLAGAQDRIVAIVLGHDATLAPILCVVLLLLLFPTYVYLNFSGYTDVVVGVARLLRLRLPENFDKPFAATGFMDFWSRWHMSLSNWIREYVYSPLLIALMRRFPARRVEPYLAVFSYFVTFFLVGVWHGQSSEFVVFGVLNGLGVSVNKLYQDLMIRRLGRPAYRKLNAHPIYRSISGGFTWCFFGFALMWFWNSWARLGAIVSALGPTTIVAGILVTILCFAAGRWAVVNIGAALRRLEGMAVVTEAMPLARTVVLSTLAFAVIAVAVILNAPAPHIVYKGF